jgi:hypothetical protein
MTKGVTGLASFLLLELDIKAPSYYFIYGNDGQA